MACVWLGLHLLQVSDATLILYWIAIGTAAGALLICEVLLYKKPDSTIQLRIVFLCTSVMAGCVAAMIAAISDLA